MKHFFVFVLVTFGTPILFGQFDIDIKTLESEGLKGKVKSIETYYESQFKGDFKTVKLTGLHADLISSDTIRTIHHNERIDFNEEGNQIFYSAHDGNGDCRMRIVIEYNSSGQVSTFIKSPMSGDKLEYNGIFDSYENLIEYVWQSNGIEEVHAYYQYNLAKLSVKIKVHYAKRGYKVFVQRFDSENRILYSKTPNQEVGSDKTYYFYDDGGHLIKEKGEYFEFLYRYDKQGNLTSASKIRTSDRLVENSIENVFNEEGKIITTIKTYDETRSEKYQYIYDEKNNLISISLLAKKHNDSKEFSLKVAETTFLFDSLGNIVRETVLRFTSDGINKIDSEYIYSNDSEGNWIVKTEYMGQISDSLSETTKRKIIYY